MTDADEIAVRRFARFVEVAGPPAKRGEPRTACWVPCVFDQPVDDEPDAPTWREYIGLS